MSHWLHVFSLQLLLALSLCGLGASLWTHIVALYGRDPRDRFHEIWLVQVILTALLLPIAADVLSRRSHVRILQSPSWMRGTLFGLLGYYALSFYYFLYWSVEHLNDAATWRMFSAGWLVLFGLACVYYWLRLEETKSRQVRM